MINFIKRLLTKKQPITYPPQVLNEKQLALVDYLDNKLVELHAGKSGSGAMEVQMCGVTFMNTSKPMEFVVGQWQISTGFCYVPRSVAILTDQDGNWLLFYAIYTEKGSDLISTRLFTDLLVRTNNARLK